MPELGGRLLHLRTEFFTYEYLFRNHTRHFHEEPPTQAPGGATKPGKLTGERARCGMGEGVLSLRLPAPLAGFVGKRGPLWPPGAPGECGA